MKSIRLSFLAACLLLIVSACAMGQGHAPRDLKGKTVYYYTTASSEPCDKDVVGKTLIYKFDENGNYTSRLDDKLYEVGSYSYGRLKPNVASLTLSYAETGHDPSSLTSPDSSETEELAYMCEMTFKSPTYGTWKTTYVDNSTDSANEYGTFQIAVDSNPSS